MGFRQATKTRTPCEVLREINDLIQGNTRLNQIIREKLKEVEKGAKLMSYEIERHDKEWNLRTWKSPNTDELEDWKRRLHKGYKV